MPILEKDAFDIQEASLQIINEDTGQYETLGYVSGLTLDGRRPEEFVNVIGGQVRRRKPEEYDWSVDEVALYDNLSSIKNLENKKFKIQVIMIDPLSLPENGGNGAEGQKLTIFGCRMSDHNFTISDSSNMRMNGRADGWEVEAITA